MKQTQSFQSFKGKNFSKQDLSHSSFIRCDFTDCNLEEANCSYSVFTGSNFTDANLRYTNFARSNLQDTIMYPKDMYGVIFSMECSTFKGMKLSKLWWHTYLAFSLQQVPELENGKDPRDGIIVSLGSERYRSLCTMMERRGY